MSQVGIILVITTWSYVKVVLPQKIWYLPPVLFMVVIKDWVTYYTHQGPTNPSIRILYDDITTWCLVLNIAIILRLWSVTVVWIQPFIFRTLYRVIRYVMGPLYPSNNMSSITLSPMDYTAASSIISTFWTTCKVNSPWLTLWWWGLTPLWYTVKLGSLTFPPWMLTTGY